MHLRLLLFQCMRYDRCMQRLSTAIVLKVLSFASVRLMVSGGNWAKAVREIITYGITLSLSCIKGRNPSAPLLLLFHPPPSPPHSCTLFNSLPRLLALSPTPTNNAGDKKGNAAKKMIKLCN